MVVDGKRIAAEIYGTIRRKLAGRRPHPYLAVFTCAPNRETRKFLELKKKRAGELGIDVAVIEFGAGIDGDTVAGAIADAGGKADGIVVQLPFPAHIDAGRLIAAVPPELDVDALRYDGSDTDILPPVVGAVAAIAEHHNVRFAGKRVAVIGEGRLVGQPAALWARRAGASVLVIGKDTANAAETIKNAEIIISGTGTPGLITPAKIGDGVVLFDAGTSEEGGQLRGDADPACAPKCSLFTPVPGGIGPVTIAVLLRNLVELAGRQPHE